MDFMTPFLRLLAIMNFGDVFLSNNKPCFQCNTASTSILVSNTCEIKFHDVIGQSTVPMYSSAKILKNGRPTWPN